MIRQMASFAHGFIRQASFVGAFGISLDGIFSPDGEQYEAYYLSGYSCCFLRAYLLRHMGIIDGYFVEN
jgi:hypothetical protein